MRKAKWLGVLLALALVFAACGDDDEGSVEGAEFTIFGAPQAAEADAMDGFIDVYNAEMGTNITFEGSDSFETQLQIRVDGGNPPPVAFTPQPASICPLADEGHLIALEDMGFDIDEMNEERGKFMMDLGLCDDGKHYGIPWFPNFKSVVFYHVATFEAEGYDIPATYEDMVALSSTMVADGYTPWCFAFESDQASGWPATDWLEDIMIRMHGGDVYGQWFRHEIPFNDPKVIQAFDKFGEIFFGEGFVLGGTDSVSAINFRDTPLPAFNDPPGCLMFKQGSFIANYFPEGGEGVMDVFPFPSIGGQGGAMGGGDFIMVFDDTEPGLVAAVKDWITPEWNCVLASPGGGTASEYGGHGVAGVERLPGHKDVDPNCYETAASISFAETITAALAANTFAFDASDLMPPEVGQRSFWDGMIDWSRGTPTQEVVDSIEASWP
jgi:alpha-glucoside transport system substrate-binding protein